MTRPPILLMYYVYLPKSSKDLQLYIGSTSDLHRRLVKHNKSQSPATRYRVPFDRVYHEAYSAEADARSREHSLTVRGSGLNQLKRRVSKSLRCKVGVRMKL